MVKRLKNYLRTVDVKVATAELRHDVNLMMSFAPRLELCSACFTMPPPARCPIFVVVVHLPQVDMTIDRDDMIAHFGAYGEVTGISMNPTRGYAFIDYRNNECVALALR